MSHEPVLSEYLKQQREKKMKQEICTYKLWSKDEIDYLIKNYRKIETQILANNLNKSKGAIIQKARKIGISTDYMTENNPMYNPNSINYATIHGWVRRRLIKPEVCPKCNKKAKRLDLAYKIHSNGIGDLYVRDLDMWEYLCRSCHMIADGRINNLKQSRCNNGKL